MQSVVLAATGGKKVTPGHNSCGVAGQCPWTEQREAPRAELHEPEVRVMCVVADSTGAERLAELMSIA